LHFEVVTPGIVVAGFVRVGDRVVMVDGVDDRFIYRREVERALSRSVRTRALSTGGRHRRRMMMVIEWEDSESN